MDELQIGFWVLASGSSLLVDPPMVTDLAADAVLAAVVDRDLFIIITPIFLSAFAARAAINQCGEAAAYVAGSVVPSAFRGSDKQLRRRRVARLAQHARHSRHQDIVAAELS